ncbi:MAG: BrnT family toxin [Candidatus Binatia bacterium]
MRIDWDKEKERRNQAKHGVSFQEVASLFTSGADYLEIFDEDNSVSEDRFKCIGPIVRGIVVVITAEPDEETLRIISARRATRRECELYARYVGGDGL